MAAGNVALPSAETELPLGNPWIWMLAGIGLTGTALVSTHLLNNTPGLLHISLIAIGLLCAGCAVAIRLNSKQDAFAERFSKNGRFAVLGLSLIVLGGIVLALAAIVFGNLADMEMPWGLWTSTLAFVVFAPIAGELCRRAFRCMDKKQPLGKSLESAVLLAAASLCGYLGCWALYEGAGSAENWDTIRLFLAVAAVVTFLCAPLPILPRTARRVVISIVILFHFGGITTAVMSAPPTSWLFQQIWGRIYRPYLQFMYLNNAYQFYAPEPGPSTFMWFRIEYQNPQGEIHWRWVKFPKIKGDGIPDYNMSLRYQRRLAMNDTTQATDVKKPPLLIWRKDGNAIPNPIYYWRRVYSDQKVDEMLGKVIPREPPVKIPYHPALGIQAQYRKPDFYPRKLMESFCYHMIKQPHPDHPNDKALSVKLYRVIHVIPTAEMISAGIEGTNPVLYQPYYMGKFGFDQHGKFGLLDEPKFDDDGNLLSGDPLLYWMIPILPENPNALMLNKTVIFGHVFRHAGDRKWIWYPNSPLPQEEKRK